MKNVIDSKGKVADLATSLELQKAGFNATTEKAWVKNEKFGNNYKLVSHLRKSFSKSNGNDIFTFINADGQQDWHYADGISIVPTPDFSEVWNVLPDEVKEGYFILLAKNRRNDHSIFYESTNETTFLHFGNNLGQLASELWLKLHKENLLKL